MSKFTTREEDCAAWARVETSPYENRRSTIMRKSGYWISSVLATKQTVGAPVSYFMIC